MNRGTKTATRLAVLVFFILTNQILAQNSVILSLPDAIRIGQENSRALKISSAKVDAAQAKESEASVQRLPSLKLAASYQRLSDVDPFQVSVPFLPQPIVIAPTVLNNYATRVSLQQPLFTGFKLEGNARAAEYAARAAEFDNKNETSDITFSITVAYWTLYQTIEVKRLVDENVVRLETNEQDTKNLLNAGLVTRNDLLKVQLQLNNARLAQIDARNDVELAMMNLNNIIGQPLETQIQLASKPWPPAEPENMPRFPGEPDSKPFREGDDARSTSDLLNRALSSRADLQAMQSRVEAARAAVSAAQGNWWPQIFLTGNYYYNRPNQRYQPTRDEFKGTWDVGVQMQLDLWNWGTTAHQTDQARALLQQQELMYDQMKENVTLDVRRQLLAVLRAKEKVQVAMLAIEQAEENQRTLNDKYKRGLATSTDLLDANVTLLQAKTNYSGSLIEHEIARTRLDRVTGSL